MVKIYSVQNQPDYDNPWNMKGPKSFSGSGCVIDGNRILTNAHMVSDQTFIQVRRHGQSKKYRADVLAVSHEADLALMTLKDAAFFKGVEPLKFAELPEVRQEVVVYGFPEDGAYVQSMENESLKIMYGLKSNQSGALVTAVIPGSPADGNLLPGDVILSNLINYFSHEKPTQAGEEVVIIFKVLPSDVNQGYEDFTNERIVEVNGIKIRNLQHLISLVEGGSDDPFVVFETRRGLVIAMDRKKVAAKQSMILQTYQISADRSDNLKSVDEKRQSDDFAATDFHDSNLNSHEEMTD